MPLQYYYPPEDLEELPGPKDNGLKNEFGFLFHHYMPIEMSTEQKEYMKNFDIEINDSHVFTQDEDEILMKNWQKFIAINEFKYHEPFALIGFRIPWWRLNIFHHRFSATKSLKAWPELCAGLDSRTAISIQRRLSLILDKNYQPGQDEPSEEQIEQINWINPNKNSLRLRKLCEKEKIPLYFVAMYSKKDTETKILAEKEHSKEKKKYKEREKKNIKYNNPRTRSFCLFNAILKFSETSEVDFATVLSKLKSKKIHEMIEKSGMEWKDLKKRRKSKNYKEEEWDELVDRFVEVYRDNMMENEKKGKYSEMTWLMTKKIVFSQKSSFCERSCFIRCLYKCVNPEAIFLEQNDAFDEHQLREKLANLGFASACTSEEAATWTLFQQLAARFKVFEEEVFQFLNPKPNLKEKLMIYFESSMRHKTSAGLKTDIFNTNLVEVVRKIAEEYYEFRNLSDAQNIERKLEIKNVVDRKRRKFVESPVLKRLKVRILTEEEKNSIQIPRIANNFNESHHSSSADESTFIDISEMDTTRNSASFLRPDETVLAGGGERAEKQNVQDSFFESSIQDEFSSRIIEIPVHIEKEAPKLVIIPKEPVSNWLDLLG